MLIIRAIVFMVTIAAASHIQMLLDTLSPTTARRLEDVSFDMLQNDTVIQILEENSLLISQIHPNAEFFSLSGNHGPKDSTSANTFIHMEYVPDTVTQHSSESVNIHGCFDNTFSSTASQVAMTYGSNKFFSKGPRFFFSLLGSQLAFSTTLGFDRTREEKLSCTVGPGERLQLQLSTAISRVYLKRQRTLTFQSSTKNLILGPWQSLDMSNALEFSSEVVTCVTDEELLSC